jgi:anti-sigma regulatory factor (Ser/Thr protein kinase)
MAARPLLAGDGVPDAALGEAAQRFRSDLAPAGLKPDIFLAAQISKANLAQLLSHTGKALIEYPCPSSPALLDPPHQGHALLLSLGTNTAFDLPLAEEFCAALWERLPIFPAARHETVEFALQEAVANALVHGNLGVPGHFKETKEGFEHYCATLSQRRNTPAYAERRLDISAHDLDGTSIRIVVADQGEGYELNGQSAAQAHSKAGRGLTIIRELADETVIDDGGRRITLIFRDRGDRA